MKIYSKSYDLLSLFIANSLVLTTIIPHLDYFISLPTDLPVLTLFLLHSILHKTDGVIPYKLDYITSPCSQCPMVVPLTLSEVQTPYQDLTLLIKYLTLLPLTHITTTTLSLQYSQKYQVHSYVSSFVPAVSLHLELSLSRYLHSLFYQFTRSQLK